MNDTSQTVIEIKEVTRDFGKTRALNPATRILSIGLFWLCYVLILFGLSLRYLPEGMVSWYALLAGLVIFTPVLGIMGAPLALHYNRHR